MKIKRPDIEVPENMQSLPMTDLGYLKPWFVTGDDFRIVDTSKARIAEAKEACWICGKPFTESVFGLVCDSLSALTLVLREPPCHPECAEYALQVCPFLLYPNAKRRTAGLKADQLLENVNRKLTVKYNPENAGEHYLLIVDDFWYHSPSKTIRCDNHNVIDRQHWVNGVKQNTTPDPILEYEQLPQESKDSITKDLFQSIYIRKDRKHQIKQVSVEEFGSRYWTRPTNYYFAAQEATLSVGLRELYELFHHFPIAFTKRNGKYSLYAIFSLIPNRNRFVNQDGSWAGAVLPESYKLYPFRLGTVNHVQNLLCVDVSSKLVFGPSLKNTPSSCCRSKFFGSENRLSPELGKISSSLIRLANDRLQVNRVCEIIADKNLIIDWNVELKADNGSPSRRIRGLMCIDEARLNSLSGSELVELRDAGALMAVYCQLHSMKHIRKLF